MVRRSVITNSLEETQAFAKMLALQFKLGDIVCLNGELGAGKTTLVKALIAAIATIDPHEVKSPTFNYCHTYGNIHHFDLYRLKNLEDFLQMGFDEYFNDQTLCFIEWSDRIQTIIPPQAWTIHINVIDDTTRKVTYEKNTFCQSTV